MNPLRRFDAIMEVLLDWKEASVHELSEKLQVTGKTACQYLAKLDKKGLLVRVQGGALLNPEHPPGGSNAGNGTPVLKPPRVAPTLP